jgi:hypothetical protein
MTAVDTCNYPLWAVNYSELLKKDNKGETDGLEYDQTINPVRVYFRLNYSCEKEFEIYRKENVTTLGFEFKME